LQRIEAEGPGWSALGGLPGQVQPAYTLAYALRRRLPGLHLTVGGPAITQMLAPLSANASRGP